MRWLSAAAVAAGLLAAAGCGGGGPPPSGKTEPFAEAIERHLEARSMGMRIDSFESLEVRGDSATAEVRMTAKDLEYGMRPRWTITFEKADGEWAVKQIDR